MNNKLPITRMSKFLSQDDFDLNIQMGQEYLHVDFGIKLVLYRVDKQKTEMVEFLVERSNLNAIVTTSKRRE